MVCLACPSNASCSAIGNPAHAMSLLNLHAAPPTVTAGVIFHVTCVALLSKVGALPGWAANLASMHRQLPDLLCVTPCHEGFVGH